jgi:hypothetical protein
MQGNRLVVDAAKKKTTELDVRCHHTAQLQAVCREGLAHYTIS